MGVADGMVEATVHSSQEAFAISPMDARQQLQGTIHGDGLLEQRHQPEQKSVTALNRRNISKQ
ncbi:MAG: hypothetical protein DI532_05190 [Azospirillum brasilense]|nr:MAG: hypothetical protein DI532_05190 [Azospirillum brasilense]